MKLRKYLAAVLSLSMAMSCAVMPMHGAMAADKDYGTVTDNADGSKTLNFGQDSITTKGGGSIVTDSVNGGVLRPDNLKTNDADLAVLTMPSVNLKGSGYDKLDLFVATKNTSNVSVKVGDTEIASITGINTGAWDSYQAYTAALATTEAEGNLTLNISGVGAKTYCGNYVYVKLYSSSSPQVTNPPSTPGPVVTQDPSGLLPYQNEALSFEERAADLVSRMTLEEKVSQLGYKAAAIDRLGVSAYDYWKEALHGVARQGKATSFPTALSMSNTWNRELLYALADATSTEARIKNSRYNLSYWSPTVNMARDPRWGRNEETMGEDPYLTGQLAAEFVKGMQGDDEKYLKTIATLKHFAANNNETNRSSGSSIMTEYNFRNYYTKVFQNITEIEMPASVMSSYNGTSIYRNGELVYNFIPSLGNSYLLQDLLRRNWGFDGYITSDCGAGEYLLRSSQFKQGILGRTDLPDEAYIAEIYKNGLNVECNLSGGNKSTSFGVMAVENGYLSEQELERVVYELFLQRFKTGEFDANVSYRNVDSSKLESDEHVAIAESVAEESWVLLKNDGILPLGGDAPTPTAPVATDDPSDEYPYTIVSAEFENDSTLSVTYTKNEGSADNAMLIAAAYNEGGVMTAIKSVTADGSGKQNIDIAKPANGTVKAYIWDSLDSVKPLAKAVASGGAAKAELRAAENDGYKVAVVGNMANTLALGDYSASNLTKTKTPIQGMKEEITAQIPGAEVNHLGAVSDTEKLFNVKSITLVLKDGKTRAVDISKADSVSGMTLSNGIFTDVTPKASAVIKNVNFQNVVTVRVEMATGSQMGGSLNIAYGNGGPTVASVLSQATADLNTYAVCEGEYTGEDGGYNGTVDMYISASPAVAPFSVEAYKTELDEADVIIAYAGTVPKQDGFGTADSSESHDRSDINLPASQSHVTEITNAYPDKTVVVMSTVGQINVEPFMDKCKAILWTSYNGQTQGTALGKVLTGQVNPSGRLSTTWYKNADVNKMELANRSPQNIGGISGNYTNYDIQADGTNPGHTYQYYSQSPIYPFGYGLSYTDFEYSNMTIDNTSVDANGTVKFTVDVKNAGTVAGKDVVQLYVAHPNAGQGLVPQKQLKGFEKVELVPGETKTVTITLNVRDMYLFSETEQKDIVPTGEYTAYMAKNADDTSNSKKFNVTGTLASTIKTVKAIPSGITVSGVIEEDGSGLGTLAPVKANLSAVMSDEVVLNLASANVTYTSADTNIATVSANGIVSSGNTEGVTTITASVTVNGETKSTTFPVVNKLQIKPSSAEIEAAKAQLKSAYDALPKAAYSAANLAELERIYNEAVAILESAGTKDELNNALAKAINDINSVAMDNLTNVYTIGSVNPNYIVNGMIDYREGGIPMYNGAVGTVTNNNPHSGIKLEVRNADGSVVDSSNFVWQIKKFDNSVRKVADIDSKTGELTVYGNGIVQITAADVENLVCGTIMVQINMQIEAEYADEANGADLNDSQNGTSGGHDAGSTGNAWIEYKSVKLSNLESIIARYASKNAGTINVSLAKDTLPDNLIASSTVSATGAWATWSEAELTLNNEVIYNAQQSGKLDEYGCADIYIQTNGLNLDYFRLNYIENNDEIPYTINKVLNMADGKIKVTLGYRGSTLATDVTLSAIVNGKETTAAVRGTGEYVLELGAADGDAVTIVVKDAERNLSEVYDHTYNTPVDSEIVVYSLNSTDPDYSVLTGTADKEPIGTTVNGMTGYGKWTIVNSKADYTYSDVNEKTYSYSFTRAWQAGSGSTTNRSLYFTPKSECKVTAVFLGSEPARSMKMWQSNTVNAETPGTGGVATVSLEITDTSLPVYVYGGSSNKQLYAIIVEYYGKNETSLSSAESAEEAIDRPVQFIDWGGKTAVLTKNDATDETKVWLQAEDGARTQLDTNYFYEADVPYGSDDKYTINSLAVYKDRLYAGCDNGLVIVFTECVKCYKLKKACDIDIKTMDINDGVMYISDGDTELEFDMSNLGGDSIEADEAQLLAANGAM
ncbi:MAG: glycoside hydrolase family 3 C-terminal domain-containing protein, partial [Oscillospiraceae bacterium]|nr:glycoside hydrolase family 3 C-terminal domain-containing protein [Oscillospiraceae bacterium]